MIITGTILKKADNSGAKLMKCVHVLGGSKRKNAHLGDIIRVCLKRIDYTKENLAKIKKNVFNALIIGVTAKTKRRRGKYIKFDKNRAVLLSEKRKFLGTRVYGPLCKELKNSGRRYKFKKLTTYAHGAI